MNTRCNKEQFIRASKALYGNDAFDYSFVDYINGYTEIALTCKKHGTFHITPQKHLRIKSGCPICSKENRETKAPMSTYEYKQLIIKKHGNIYDLSKTIYNGMKANVTATCEKHGDFTVNAYNFIHKQGCPKCGIELRQLTRKGRVIKNKTLNMTTESFIAASQKKFNNYYIYNKTDIEHKDAKGRVCITCPIHGDFWQSPYSHLNGHGCRVCGREKVAKSQTLSTEEFINKSNIVHNFKYDYSNTVYTGCYNNVDIICPKHGLFTQKAYSHLNGHGCKLCADEENAKKLLCSTQDFIKKASIIHGGEDYSLSDYKGSKIPITIICKNGHVYAQIPNKHLSGHGCPYCNNTISQSEKEISGYIESLGFHTQTSNRSILSNAKEIDIYIPEKKLGIEFDGLYWHNEINRPDKNYHLNKTIECEKLGIRLIHIFEDEWLNHKDIIKSRLEYILGRIQRKIYARKCKIKSIDNHICYDFLTNNHIQGNVNSSIKYGMYYNDELVAVMTFGKVRKNLGRTSDGNTYELLRFCNKLHTTVIGGADKLFKHFINDIHPSAIFTYADRRWNTGNIYQKMGFKFTHYSQPNYFYIIGQSRQNRFNFRKDILVKEGFDKNKSEHQIMMERGIYRIYDCGTKVYEWKG